MTGISAFFGAIGSSLVFERSLFLKVLVLTATLAIVALFIYAFYRSLSRRNLLSLNLYRYNTSDHPITSKLFAMILYLVEYILFIPFMILLWFAGLAVVLLLIAKDGQDVSYILLISASMIGAIRILSYVKTEICRDLAKLFPLITLSVFLLTPGEFNLDVVLRNVQVIPSLLGHILSYVLAIFAVEIILRIFYTLYEFYVSEDKIISTKKSGEHDGA